MTNPIALTVLQLRLHGTVVGHLMRQASGATALVFNPTWANDPQRCALTLSGNAPHPAHAALFKRPWFRPQGLHPLLANLLPEAGLRPALAAHLQLSADDEIPLLTALGAALPGGWQARALAADEIPPGLLDFNARVSIMPPTAALPAALRSFAGSQPKQVTTSDQLLKLPTRPGQTRSEYSALQLARLAGVDCVDHALLPPDATNMQSPLAYLTDEPILAVQRFDRSSDGTPIHTEDFAQVLFKPAQEKYTSCDAVQLGRLLYCYTPHGLKNVQEFARRLLMNVLLGNGDAHLKNWSLRYPDQHTAELAPAYDLAFTQPLGVTEHSLAIAGCSDWYALEFSHFDEWSRAVGVPWRAIRPALLDTVERARALWPGALEQLPMTETDKLLLRHHWKSLGKKLQYGL